MEKVGIFIEDADWLQESADDLAQFISAQCAPPSTLPMWRWWEDFIVLDSSGPMPGRYRTELTPMVRWLADWAQNSRVKRITGMGAAQTIKTQFLLNLFNWTVNESPGTTMWVMADGDSVREFWTKRLEPSIQNCEPSKGRFSGRIKDLICFNSMNLLLRGSNSRSKLQSDPVRRLICDERREWKAGAIDLVRKRTRTFSTFQEVSVGTAGFENDELHCDYLEGSQTVPHFHCLKCDHSQPFRFGKDAGTFWKSPREKGGIIWETSDITKPNGKWNFVALKKTVRYQCENCGHLYHNSDKFELLKTIHPHDYNPGAAFEHKSLHWGALSFIWENVSWENIAEEFLRAKEMLRIGNPEPMKAFITETLGEPWGDELAAIDDFGFLEARRQDYEFGDAWPEERFRFMAVDKQARGGEHYWWVIRAFGFNGKSRLIAHGKALTMAELVEIQKAYNVRAQNCMMDSGYSAQEVYRFCLSNGWKAFKGDPDEYYVVAQPTKDPRIRKSVRQFWRKTRAAVVNAQTKAKIAEIPLFTFCNDPVKDLLADFMKGLVGEWSMPKKTGDQFLKQITAEVRQEKIDPKGRVSYFWKQQRADNHYLDCELMIIVAAVASKTISPGNISSNVPPSVDGRTTAEQIPVAPSDGARSSPVENGNSESN